MNAGLIVFIILAAALVGGPAVLLLHNRLVPGFLEDRDVESWLDELHCTCTVPPSGPTDAAITSVDCPTHGSELAAIREARDA